MQLQHANCRAEFQISLEGFWPIIHPESYLEPLPGLASFSALREQRNIPLPISIKPPQIINMAASTVSTSSLLSARAPVVAGRKTSSRTARAVRVFASQVGTVPQLFHHLRLSG